MMMRGSGTDSEISLCGRTFPPFMYSSSRTMTSLLSATSAAEIELTPSQRRNNKKSSNYHCTLDLVTYRDIVRKSFWRRGLGFRVGISIDLGHIFMHS